MALLHDYAWFVENSGRTTHPVGGKNPNAWGIHDMSGNVAEWCLDWFGTYPTGSVTDPVGPRSGDFRVFRGSSFGSQPGFSNCAERGSATPDHLYDFLGFRVVAVAE